MMQGVGKFCKLWYSVGCIELVQPLLIIPLSSFRLKCFLRLVGCIVVFDDDHFVHGRQYCLVFQMLIILLA